MYRTNFKIKILAKLLNHPNPKKIMPSKRLWKGKTNLRQTAMVMNLNLGLAPSTSMDRWMASLLKIFRRLTQIRNPSNSYRGRSKVDKWLEMDQTALFLKVNCGPTAWKTIKHNIMDGQAMGIKQETIGRTSWPSSETSAWVGSAPQICWLQTLLPIWPNRSLGPNRKVATTKTTRTPWRRG